MKGVAGRGGSSKDAMWTLLCSAALVAVVRAVPAAINASRHGSEVWCAGPALGREELGALALGGKHFRGAYRDISLWIEDELTAEGSGRCVLRPRSAAGRATVFRAGSVAGAALRACAVACHVAHSAVRRARFWPRSAAHAKDSVRPTGTGTTGCGLSNTTKRTCWSRSARAWPRSACGSRPSIRRRSS